MLEKRQVLLTIDYELVSPIGFVQMHPQTLDSSEWALHKTV
jgi:hypothetical protein